MHRRPRFPALLPLALLLGACRSVGPEYHAPSVATPAHFRGADQQDGRGEPVAPAVDQWWTVFNDPILTQRIEKALVASPQLGIAVARLDEARALLQASQAQRAPSLAVNASAQLAGESAQRTLALPNGQVNYRDRGDSYRVPFDLNYELDLWGRVRRLNESARATLEASEDDLRTARLALSADVAVVHYTQLSLAREIAVVDQTLADRAEQLSIQQSRVQAGLGSDADVERIRVEVANAEADRADLQRRWLQTSSALAVLLGNPQAEPPLNASSVSAISIPSIPVGLPSDLLQRRPDLRSAERAIAARTADIGVARAAFFPQIRLTGSAGFESPDLGHLFERPAQFWGFGPGVSFTFLDGGRNRANLAASEARAQAAHQSYAQAVLVAFREVDDALVDLQQNDAQRAALARAQTAAEAGHRLINERYRAGLTSYLEVIDTQRSLLNVRRALAQSEGAQVLATVRLLKAIGGSWAAPSHTPDGA